MNKREVSARVKDISDMAGDDEAAHSAEDRLYVAVLMAIADGAENPAELAAEALKAQRIDFERWCA